MQTEKEIVAPCKDHWPYCCIIAYNVLSVIERKKARRKYCIYKVLFCFDCVFHGPQELQVTMAMQDDSFGFVGDWHCYAPLNLASQGRNRFLQTKKFKKRGEES